MDESRRPQIRGVTEIDVDHLGDTLTFWYHRFGPKSFFDLVREMERRGIENNRPRPTSRTLMPTMAETASLLHAAMFSYLKDESEGKQIKEALENKGLWTSTIALAVPDKGIYIQDTSTISSCDLQHIEYRLHFAVSRTSTDLVDRFESGDPSVRYVSLDNMVGSRMSSVKLARHPLLIGLAGEEGAEKLAEVACYCNTDRTLDAYLGIDTLNTPLVNPAVAIFKFSQSPINLCIAGLDGKAEKFAYGVLKK